MIRSMTGFGRCRDTVEGLDVTVEIKSVNSRYLDCTAKISRSYAYLEERVKPYLQSRGISRGKVDVYISIEALDAGEIEIALDESYLRSYLAALDELARVSGVRDDRSLMSLARNQELFRIKRPEEDVERDWARVRSVLEKAVNSFLLGKQREGESLVRDITAKMERIREAVERIEALSAEDVSSYRERLASRIREALADNQITPDETRLLTECAIHADKVAVDEELVRLRTHLDSFREILRGEEAVGRKLDFLMQEINREINTTGSKCNKAEIARIVVDVKCELEKIREQIQNLE
ncbi:MAG: YicC family protein [Clostridia bacterium]|nr:YicC family protein [Clostridia bacterium]